MRNSRIKNLLSSVNSLLTTIMEIVLMKMKKCLSLSLKSKGTVKGLALLVNSLKIVRVLLVTLRMNLALHRMKASIKKKKSKNLNNFSLLLAQKIINLKLLLNRYQKKISSIRLSSVIRSLI